MYEETLEIRGINRSDLISYLIAIGGQQKGMDTNIVFDEQWHAVVSNEQFFRFLQSDVPKVFVTFVSEDENILKGIIEKFRKKTFRAGG